MWDKYCENRGAEIKMPISKEGFLRIRAVDVGRKGHHYIKIGIRKSSGKRGGKTVRIGKLKAYK